MPDDLLGAVGRLDSNYASNVFQDAETEGNVFQEKPRISVEYHSIGNGWILWKHREDNSAVTYVCIEDALQAAFITYLTIVHGTDAFTNRQNLRKLKSGETRQKRRFYFLNLLVKEFDFVSTIFCQIFVQKRHFTCFKSLLAIPILKEGVDSTGMNDLIRGGER